MNYEKTAMDNGSPFTWSQGESLKELSSPKRIIEIKADYERRKARLTSYRKKNALQAELPLFTDNDEIYGGLNCLYSLITMRFMGMMRVTGAVLYVQNKR